LDSIKVTTSRLFEIDLKEYIQSYLPDNLILRNINFDDWPVTDEDCFLIIDGLMSELDCEDETKEVGYLSIDFKRKKLLCSGNSVKENKVKLKDVFDDYMGLNLSNEYYLNENDSKKILGFLNSYGYPFIPYTTNIDIDVYDDLIVKNPSNFKDFDNSPLQHPFNNFRIKKVFVCELMDGNFLYHLEEFRRYQLLFNHLYKNKALTPNLLEEWESGLITDVLRKCVIPELRLDKRSDTYIPSKLFMVHTYPLAFILDKLINEIRKAAGFRVETNIPEIFQVRCKYCKTNCLDIRRHHKWGHKFPYCHIPECRKKGKKEIFWERMKDPKLRELREKKLAQGRLRAKLKYERDKNNQKKR
jgi:hypothetical protein